MTVRREENHEVPGAQRDWRAFALIKDIIPFRVLVDFCQSVDVLPDDGFLAVNEVLEIDGAIRIFPLRPARFRMSGPG